MFIAGNNWAFYIVISLLLLTGSIFAQPGSLSTSELKAEAEALFEEEDYSKAYEIYKSLMERYPKDAMFNYFGGICLYKSKKDLSNAIEQLNYASSKPQVPEDVFYHLGMAYKKNYMFRESKSAFEKFNELANRSDKRDFNPELEILSASNAMQITMEYNPFEILASSLFTFSDSNYVTQVRGKGGRLTKKLPDFVTRGEETGDIINFMFMPKNIQKGEYVYFAGYPRARKSSADLYRAKKTNGNNWGLVEEIKALNTDSDEILPYFDPVSNDLYFATRGHSSMGGFDILKSHYDDERDEWSEPINLGFPVNSPDNEFLAMPGPDLGTFLLITDRQGLDSMLTVYKLILQEPRKSLASADYKEIKQIGNLGGISAIPAIVDLTEGQGQQISDAGLMVNDELPGAEMNLGPETVDPYERNVAAALAYQKKSDSLSILAKQTRNKVRSMHNPDDRWAWQRQIIEWEKASRDYREKADRIFASMENDKNLEAQNQKPDIPGTITVDRKIDDITVYKFTSDNSSSEVKTAEIEADIQDKEDLEKTSEETPDITKNSGESITYTPGASKDLGRFVILQSSPYSSENPFPNNGNFPPGPFYKIQLGVFSKTIEFDTFGGLSPITAENIPERGLTRYYAGKFTTYNDAREILGKIRNYGFKDAFIVSWYNGKKTSVDKVRELEERDRP